MTQIPRSLRGLVAGRAADGVGGVEGDAWLAGLPGTVERLRERWDLTVDGQALHGENALVLPVRRATERAVLKVTWPHAEARHEHLALRLWSGRGAVRLLAADPGAYALLLERLDAGRPLTAVDVMEACEMVGELITTLDRPAPPQIEPVVERAERWRATFGAHHPLVPRSLTEQALAELDGLLADPPGERMVHEDLHDGNVLAPLDPDRGHWLAIDPKPVAGEQAFAVAPIVWNRPEESARASSLRAHARLRAEVVAQVAGLDEARVRGWTFVRLVLNAVDAAAYAPASDSFRTRMIALAKAFAD